jgi:hypothetical protein
MMKIYIILMMDGSSWLLNLTIKNFQIGHVDPQIVIPNCGLVPIDGIQEKMFFE